MKIGFATQESSVAPEDNTYQQDDGVEAPEYRRRGLDFFNVGWRAGRGNSKEAV